MQVKATTKGQIVIPAPLRRKLGIRKGTRIEVAEDSGRIVLRPITAQALKVLLDRLQGKYKDEPLLPDLREQRARDREKEDAGWTPPGV